MATAAADVSGMPDSRGRSSRARLRALPVLGGLLPIGRSQVPADVLAGIMLTFARTNAAQAGAANAQFLSPGTRT
jgi:hypothetical protein